MIGQIDGVSWQGLLILMTLVGVLCLGIRRIAPRNGPRSIGPASRRRVMPEIGAGQPYVEQRDELLATLGHELRSPLRALLTTLGEDDATVLAQREQMQALARHALRVAEDSLDFALLERRDIALRPGRIDLEAELEQVLQIVAPLRKAGTRLDVAIQPSLALLRFGDAARLKQILVNLVSNALTHAAGGTVRLSLESRGEVSDAVDFVVLDTGPGMTPLEQQRAFELFAQGKGSKGLAGIGLAVVARLVDAMGGQVHLESEPALGTSFRVTIPMRALAPAPDPDALSERVIGIFTPSPSETRSLAAHVREWNAQALRFDTLVDLEAHLLANRALDGLVLATNDVPKSLEATLARAEFAGLRIARSRLDDLAARFPASLLRILSQPAGAARAEDLRKLSVLIVDDHPLARHVLHDHLSALGCSVTSAEDGESAVELAEDPENAFDWVLLDRRMPGLDGLATAALLRERPATRGARLALLVNEPADDPRSPDLFDQVLVRPEQSSGLRELLEATLRRPKTDASASAPKDMPDRADLERLRDETLAEDLRAVSAAYAQGDAATVEAHFHRMKGALRFCPDPALAAQFSELEACAGDRDGARFRACADAFASGLRVTSD